MDLTQQNIVQTAEDEAAEEAAFEATFSTDPGPVAETEPATSEPPAPAEQEPAATEPPKALTMDDLTAALLAQRQEHQRELKSLHDRVFGKTGELQQKIDAVRQQAHRINPKAKDRLSSDFPELAEMLFGGVEDAPPETVVQAPPPPVVLPDPRVDELSRNFERKLLSRDHRDWEQVVASPEFSAWKGAKLRPADAAALDESWDADFISGKISEFKEWQKAEAVKAATAKQKQERLAAAILPRGTQRDSRASHDADDEEAAMMASYGKRGR